MDHLHNLLDLIEKGDPLVILSEEKLTEGLNELLKNDLITFEDGKVVLTEKGRDIYVNGTASVPEPEPINEALEFSEVGRRQSRLIFLFSFAILLGMLAAFIMMLLSE